MDFTDAGLKARLASRLMAEEGFKLRLYKDSRGFWTIGCGHLCSAEELVTFHAGISREKAIALLKRDLDEAFKDLDDALPWWRMEVAPRRLVLADMCFNMGIGRLLGFKNSLKLWRQGEWAEAASNLAKSAWDKQVGIRADRLQKIVATGLDDLYAYPHPA